MVTHRAKCVSSRGLRGASLVEFMVASLAGVAVLMSVTTLFVSSQKIAVDRANMHYLEQSFYRVLRFIREDVKRAGYDGNNNKFLTFPGESSAWKITDNSLSYVYRTNNLNEPDRFELVRIIGDLKAKKLKVCSKTIRSENKLKTEECRRHYSLFDDKRIDLTAFDVTSAASGGGVILSLSVELTGVEADTKVTGEIYLSRRN